jgi:hypothetical protein
MYIDALNLLSNSQALTATGVSVSSIKVGFTASIGAGIVVPTFVEPMAIAFSIPVDADSASGDETYAFQLIQSDNADLLSPDVVAACQPPATALVAGAQFALPVPPNRVTKRYIGARYVLGGTTPSLCVTAALQPMSMIQGVKQYAKAHTI